MRKLNSREGIFLSTFILSILFLHCVSGDEGDRFDLCMKGEKKICYSSCHASCDRETKSKGFLVPFSEYPAGSLGRFWDELSVTLLGYKRIKGNPYTPCLERCLQVILSSFFILGY
eukprot:TRINITY_DN3184_c0_g1_i4.p1 TRINITY_DN3184_c0_g1~~TRINITY_DN3184_c0_g1_i4.p1  ORF type:complete len:116 (-),score=22.37 TRINITY_DN3184_c0_g1_i4:44-391(-)